MALDGGAGGGSQLSGGATHWYRIFGLAVRSEITLPEAAENLDPSAAPGDFVDIRLGPTPSALPGGAILSSWMEIDADECLYHFEDICRIHVAAGRRIVIEQFPGVPDGDVRAFLFGSGFAAIVHQRKLMPLHISAVRAPVGTIAFTGPSGAGKSTLAAAVAKYNSWPVVCDDLAVIDPGDATFALNIGARRKKLWRDAITALDYNSRPMDRDVSRIDKFHLPIDDGVGGSTSAIVHLYDLTWGGTGPRIIEAPPSKRFELIMNAIYRPYLTPFFGDIAVLQRAALAMARHMRGFVLERPSKLDALEEVAQALAQHCAKP